jgi:hypothetical protein
MARDLLAFSKSTVAHSGLSFDSAVLQELIRNMGNVSGVLHVVPGDFVRRARFVPEEEPVGGDDVSYRTWNPLRVADQGIADLFADYDTQRMYLRIVNKSQEALEGFAFALNRNAVGLVLAEQPKLPALIESGDVGEIVIALSVDPAQIANPEKNELQIALRTSQSVVYAVDRIPAQLATLPDYNIGQERFRECFQQFTATTAFVIDDALIADEGQLAEAKVFVVGKNNNKVYVSFAFAGQQLFVGELTQNGQAIAVALKARSNTLFSVVEVSARALFARK